MAHTLDYTALNEPLTKEDIKAFESKTALAAFDTRVMIITTGFFGILVMFGLLMWVQTGEAKPDIIPMAATIPAAFILRSRLQAAVRRRARLHKFAFQNDLELFTNTRDPNYAGMIFSSGKIRHINEALRFKDGIEIGNLTYVSNGSLTSRNSRAYVKVKLTRNLPHMVLDAKKGDFLKRDLTNSSELFDQSQILSLEGEFDKHFTLHVPRQYERDALYVFTPDVMAALIDHGKEYNIEIVGDELYIYGNKHFPLDKPEFYEHTLAIINAIKGELLGQTDYYSDERVGNREMNMVADAGWRLKSGFNWNIVTMSLFALVLIVCLTAVLYLLLSSFSPMLK